MGSVEPGSTLFSEATQERIARDRAAPQRSGRCSGFLQAESTGQGGTRPDNSQLCTPSMRHAKVNYQPIETDSSDRLAVGSNRTAHRAQQAHTGGSATVGHEGARSEDSLPCVPSRRHTELDMQPTATRAASEHAVEPHEERGKVPCEGLHCEERVNADGCLSCNVSQQRVTDMPPAEAVIQIDPPAQQQHQPGSPKLDHIYPDRATDLVSTNDGSARRVLLRERAGAPTEKNQPFQRGRAGASVKNTRVKTEEGDSISTLPTTSDQGSNREIGENTGGISEEKDPVELLTEAKRLAHIKLAFLKRSEEQVNIAKSGGGNILLKSNTTTPDTPSCTFPTDTPSETNSGHVGETSTAVGRTACSLQQQADDKAVAVSLPDRRGIIEGMVPTPARSGLSQALLASGETKPDSLPCVGEPYASGAKTVANRASRAANKSANPGHSEPVKVLDNSDGALPPEPLLGVGEPDPGTAKPVVNLVPQHSCADVQSASASDSERAAASISASVSNPDTGTANTRVASKDLPGKSTPRVERMAYIDKNAFDKTTANQREPAHASANQREPARVSANKAIDPGTDQREEHNANEYSRGKKGSDDRASVELECTPESAFTHTGETPTVSVLAVDTITPGVRLGGGDNC